MSELKIFQVDAFADRLFSGNPAAVIPLDNWLDDALLQAIAQENNLSETAFIVAEPDSEPDDFHIRWLTPTKEVPLCGHATLASAWVLFNRLGWPAETIRFRSKSGSLGVSKGEHGWLELDFPNLSCEPVSTPDLIRQGIPEAPETAFFVPEDTNYMIVLESEAAVRKVSPDLRALKELGNLGVIVTAPSDHCDFASRYFAPGSGIEEDPVTGSIHSVLPPYWAGRLDKSTLIAHQISRRGGVLKCELRGDRVAIAGQAAPYLEGIIEI